MNTWVKYIDRSYEQVKESLINRLKTVEPRATNFNSSNILTRIIEMVAGTTDQVNFYIDFYAREGFLMTLRRFASAILFAKAYNYRVKGAFPAEATQRFYVDTPTPSTITIPQGTIVATAANIVFETIQELQILPTQTEVFGQVIQRERKSLTPIPTTTGLPNQVVVLENNVVDNSIELSINGVYYTAVETFAYSTAIDTHFVASVNESGLVIITFGDGVNGVIPDIGQNIVANYFVTQGSNGNVSSLSINTIVSIVPSPLTLRTINNDNASGGTDSEDLETIRRKLPLFVRTLERAVTKQDFKDVTEQFTGVAKAGVVHSCGEPTRIYIAPQSGGIAPPTLINGVINWLDKRKTINIDVIVETVGVVALRYNINVTALPQFKNTDVATTVRQTLLNFHSINNQEVQGSLYLSDLYQAIDTSIGVSKSIINSIDIVPYARSLNNTTPLNWQRVVKSTSTTTQRWRIVMLAGSQYELYKGAVLQGTYNINAPISLTEIDFTVFGTYTIGHEWEFYTYPYLSKFSDTLFLAEPSILSTSTENITLTVTGGYD
jgi:hypothetical protein